MVQNCNEKRCIESFLIIADFFFLFPDSHYCYGSFVLCFNFFQCSIFINESGLQVVMLQPGLALMAQGFKNMKPKPWAKLSHSLGLSLSFACIFFLLNRFLIYNIYCVTTSLYYFHNIKQSY